MQRMLFWYLITPAEDLPGRWVAHCLDLDVVTQGEDLADAVKMLVEAVVMTVASDVGAGRDPFARSRAPEEYWLKLATVLEQGERVQNAAAAVDVDNRLVALAAQLELAIEHEHAEPRQRSTFVARERLSAPPAGA